MPGEFVDERDVVSASSKCGHLERSPHIKVDYVQEVFTYNPFLWEWMSMLFANLACFTHSNAGEKKRDKKRGDKEKENEE